MFIRTLCHPCCSAVMGWDVREATMFVGWDAGMFIRDYVIRDAMFMGKDVRGL